MPAFTEIIWAIRKALQIRAERQKKPFNHSKLNNLVILTNPLLQHTHHNFVAQKNMTMNSYLKKRKKSVFNNYKIVRTTINLNKANNQPLIAAHKTVIENKGWENNWIEQVAEMRTELNSTNQIVSKQNKLIIKWWEN